MARALLLTAASERKRILCAREFQNSIAQSVHKLLETQIEALGFSRTFRVYNDSIVCSRNGSEFIFEGLRLNDNQFSALAEFTYNVGVGSFLGSSLLRRLNQGDYQAVPGELLRWNKAHGRVLPGLVTRRAREAALFAMPILLQPPSFPTGPVDSPSVLEKIRRWFLRKYCAGEIQAQAQT